MQQWQRNIAGVCAIALIAYGIIQPPEQDIRWLTCLWLSVPFIGLAVWWSLPTIPRGIHRSVHNIGIVVAIGFVLLSLQLLRQQIVQADNIYHLVHVDSDTGQITSNVRPVLASQRIIRGGIFDRDGFALVGSEVVPGGFVKRTYPLTNGFPNPAAFSNLVGFFSTRFGQAGIEATYGDYLSGERGSELVRIQNELVGEPQVGNDVLLTIDARLQAHAYDLLNGRRGSVVVLRPDTGEVLAMASSPGFDPRGLSFHYDTDDWAAENQRISAYWQQINSDDAGQPLLNRPTQGQYPPGSTFKTITAIGVLENPSVGKPNDIRCLNQLETEQGAPHVVNAVPNLASLTGDPSTLEKVYAYSCNVAFATYALRLGANLLAQQAARFDIYAPDDAPDSYHVFPDLPSVPSLLYVQNHFLERAAALADTGYGQGQLLVTPLQMAMVAAAVANDGIMMKPYLVQSVKRPDASGGGTVVERMPQEIRRVMSRETAATMRNNMAAVGKYGFGSSVNVVPGILIGGKSGTGEHVPGATPHAWFIAIAPVENPRYAVCAMVESGGEGSSVAALLAGNTLKKAFEIEQ